MRNSPAITESILTFILRDDGVLEVVPIKQSASKLKGMIPKPAKAVSIEMMNKAIAKHDLAWAAMLDYSMSNEDYANCVIARINRIDGFNPT